MRDLRRGCHKELSIDDLSAFAVVRGGQEVGVRELRANGHARIISPMKNSEE